MWRLFRVLVLLVLAFAWAPRVCAETAELVTDINFAGGVPGSSPAGFTAVSRSGEAVIFGACEGSVRRVWRSDGTASGTFALPGDAFSCASAEPHPVAAGGLAFYLARAASGKLHLWRTDGTAAGTFRITPDNIGPISELTVFGDGVAFRVGNRLWRADGSLLGTHPYALIPVNAVDPHFLIALGSKLFFVAEGLGNVNEQLWITDGTEAGTVPLTDFHTFAFDPETPPEMAQVGNTFFFVALDLLWATDGTAAGTAPVLSSTTEGASPSDLFVFHNALYFMADTRRNGLGRALWRSDASGISTVRLIGPPAGTPAGFTALGDRLFFVAEDGVHGTELWSTDGTFGGTTLAGDIATGAASSNPASLAAAGNRVFFAADGITGGVELWESDGTPVGTRQVQDIAPGGGSSSPEEITLSGGRLFFAADDGLHGTEPWSLLLAGGGCVPSAQVLCLGGRFRVVADWRDFQGNRGDGTAVALTGDTGYFWFFNPSNVEVVLKVLDGRGVNGHYWVFYGALSDVEYALTVTDTATGAVRRYENPSGRLASVGDVEAFGPSSAAGVVTEGPAPLLGDEPWTETWSDAAATAGCTPSATRLCLNGGRFAVEARWKDFQGNTGNGQAVPLDGGDTGYFWFFGPENVEVVLKVLDGRALNDRFWVFYGALSNVEYTLTVTDTQSGVVKTYINPSGRQASVADTAAF